MSHILNSFLYYLKKILENINIFPNIDRINGKAYVEDNLYVYIKKNLDMHIL